MVEVSVVRGGGWMVGVGGRGGGCFSVGISGGNSFSLGGGGGEWICDFLSLDWIVFLLLFC